jgi:HrpA-like RNA helicase
MNGSQLLREENYFDEKFDFGDGRVSNQRKLFIMEELRKELETLKVEIACDKDASLNFCLEVLKADREEKKKYKAKANENYAKDWLSARMKEMEDWVYEDYHEEIKWEIIDEKAKLKEENEKLKERERKVLDYLAGNCECRIEVDTICDWFGITSKMIEERIHDRMIENMSSDDEDDDETSP